MPRTLREPLDHVPREALVALRPAAPVREAALAGARQQGVVGGPGHQLQGRQGRVLRQLITQGRRVQDQPLPICVRHTGQRPWLTARLR